jgi:uncharacterized repeat protein (TIGR01451 family)
MKINTKKLKAILSLFSVTIAGTFLLYSFDGLFTEKDSLKGSLVTVSDNGKEIGNGKCGPTFLNFTFGPGQTMEYLHFYMASLNLTYYDENGNQLSESNVDLVPFAGTAYQNFDNDHNGVSDFSFYYQDGDGAEFYQDPMHIIKQKSCDTTKIADIDKTFGCAYAMVRVQPKTNINAGKVTGTVTFKGVDPNDEIVTKTVSTSHTFSDCVAAPSCEITANGQTGEIDLPEGNSSVDLAWTLTNIDSGELRKNGVKIQDITNGETITEQISEESVYKIVAGEAECNVSINVAPSCTFEAIEDEIFEGDSVTLNWTTLNTTSNRLNNINVNANETEYKLAGLPIGNQTITLEAVARDGTIKTCTDTVKVKNKLGPTCTIKVKDGFPSTIQPGNTTRIEWTVENATSASITNLGNVAPENGEKETAPLNTSTNFVMTVIGNGKTGTCSTNVAVQTAPDPTCQLNVKPGTPNPVNYNDRATLTWTAQNATQATIDNGVGNVNPLTGETQTQALIADTQFTMTVTGNGKTATCTANVGVNTEPSCSIQPQGSDQIREGEDKTFDVNIYDPLNQASSIRFFNTNQQSEFEAGSHKEILATITENQVTNINQAGNVPFEIRFFNSQEQEIGQSCRTQINVNAINNPVCTAFTANPSAIYAGDQSTLHLETQNADTANIDNGVGDVNLQNGTADIGVLPNATTTYIATLENQEGGTTTCSTEVRIMDLPSCEITSTPIQNQSSDIQITINDTNNTITGATINHVDNQNNFDPSPIITRPVNQQGETFTLNNVNISQDTDLTVLMQDASGRPFTCSTTLQAVATCAIAVDPVQIENGNSGTVTIQYQDPDNRVTKAYLNNIDDTLNFDPTHQPVDVFANIQNPIQVNNFNQEGDYTFAVGLTDANDNHVANCQADFSIIPQGAPSCTLTVDSPLPIGSIGNLSWTTQNTVSAEINSGVGVINNLPQGSAQVSPTQDTTYTMTVTSADGRVATCNTQALLLPACTLTNNGPVDQGLSATLTWDTEGVITNATMLPAITNTPDFTQDGSELTNPLNQNTTFTLTLENPNGQNTCQTQVLINQAPTTILNVNKGVSLTGNNDYVPSITASAGRTMYYRIQYQGTDQNNNNIQNFALVDNYNEQYIQDINITSKPDELTCNDTGAEINCTMAQDLPSGTTEEILYTATLVANTPSNTSALNTVTATATNALPVTDSATASTSGGGGGNDDDVIIRKSVSSSSASNQHNITYTIEVENEHQSSQTVSLQDTISGTNGVLSGNNGGRMTFVQGSEQASYSSATPGTHTGSILDANGITITDLPAKATFTLKYVMTASNTGIPKNASSQASNTVTLYQNNAQIDSATAHVSIIGPSGGSSGGGGGGGGGGRRMTYGNIILDIEKQVKINGKYHDANSLETAGLIEYGDTLPVKFRVILDNQGSFTAENITIKDTTAGNFKHGKIYKVSNAKYDEKENIFTVEKAGANQKTAFTFYMDITPERDGHLINTTEILDYGFRETTLRRLSTEKGKGAKNSAYIRSEIKIPETRMPFSKTANLSTVKAGGEIEYKIVLKNPYEFDLKELTIVDTFPKNQLEIVHVGIGKVKDNTVTWTKKRLRPGQWWIIKYKARANQNLENDTKITNIARFTPNTKSIPELKDDAVVAVSKEAKPEKIPQTGASANLILLGISLITFAGFRYRHEFATILKKHI